MAECTCHPECRGGACLYPMKRTRPKLKELADSSDIETKMYADILEADTCGLSKLETRSIGFTAACKRLTTLEATNAALVEALEKIKAWEMPPTGRTWDDGSEMSYSAVNGSNGEREHVRGVARAALKLAKEANHG